MKNNILQERHQQVLYDLKWHKFLKRTWLFKHIPFVDAVFGSGSLAIGNVNEHSDFDVLICARGGRIFTARFFAVVLFGLFGWRRSKLDHRVSAQDKVCLNHFVTPSAYRLRLQPNNYWRLLYQRLVPLYGSQDEIQRFFDANSSWAGKRVLSIDARYLHAKASLLRRIIERFLNGSAGSWLERHLKAYQVKRIERGLSASKERPIAHQMAISGIGERACIDLEPLIAYTDEELDFHPDPATIELS